MSDKPISFPLIALNTLPKSGSVFMVETLCRGLGCRFMAVSDGSFPSDPIVRSKLRTAARGRCLTQEHFDASEHNLRLLREYCPRVVVHLRDPRQAMLSWIHHVIKLVQDDEVSTLEYVDPSPPLDLLESPLSQLIDWHIAHYYLGALAWMERWLEVAEAGISPRVLITTYEKYRDNWQAMAHDILDFYGIPRLTFQDTPVPRDSSTHFRVGRVDEFREVFSHTQLRLTEELLCTHPRVARLYAERIPEHEAQRQSVAAPNNLVARIA